MDSGYSHVDYIVRAMYPAVPVSGVRFDFSHGQTMDYIRDFGGLCNIQVAVNVANGFGVQFLHFIQQPQLLQKTAKHKDFAALNAFSQIFRER